MLFERGPVTVLELTDLARQLASELQGSFSLSSQVRDYKHTILLHFFMCILGIGLMSSCLPSRRFPWLRCLPGPLYHSLFPFIMYVYVCEHMDVCFHVCECTGVGRCVLKPEVDVRWLLWSLPPLLAKAGPGNWTQSSLIQLVQRGSWPLYLPLSLPPVRHTCPAFHSGSGNPIFAPHTFLVGGHLISRATVQFPTSVLTAILQVFVAAYVFWGYSSVSLAGRDTATVPDLNQCDNSKVCQLTLQITETSSSDWHWRVYCGCRD